MTNAAIYARISQDEFGTEKGVKRQLEDARQLAEQRGWEVVGEYIDNDVSAYNGDARREYQRLMVDAEARRFEQIIVWQQSRLWRSRVERAQAIEVLKHARVGIAMCKGQDLDLSVTAGRMMAGMLGEFDTAESEIKAERIQRAARQRAEEGRPHAICPYGWQRVYELNGAGRRVGFHDDVEPHQAAIVNEIVNRLLAGDSAQSICADLNARGEPTPRGHAGARWLHTPMVDLARRPANVGLRTYRGEVVGKGEWPPIVDQDRHDRLISLLADPNRARTRDGRRRHLLTHGIGECGVCGGPLRSRKVAYACIKGCVERSEADVDALVAAVVVERLSRPDAASIFDQDDSGAQAARDRADAIRARLNTAADEYADGAIDGEQLRRITARLRPDLETAEAELRSYRRPALPDDAEKLMGDRATGVWASLPVAAKRAVLRVLGLEVVIHRNGRRPGFTPEAIEFRWG